MVFPPPKVNWATYVRATVGSSKSILAQEGHWKLFLHCGVHPCDHVIVQVFQKSKRRSPKHLAARLACKRKQRVIPHQTLKKIRFRKSLLRLKRCSLHSTQHLSTQKQNKKALRANKQIVLQVVPHCLLVGPTGQTIERPQNKNDVTNNDTTYIMTYRYIHYGWQICCCCCCCIFIVELVRTHLFGPS